MIAYIVFCNDSAEFVVIDDEAAAIEKCKVLKEIYFKINRWMFGSEEEYSVRCRWHVRQVAASLRGDALNDRGSGDAALNPPA